MHIIGRLAERAVRTSVRMSETAKRGQIWEPTVGGEAGGTWASTSARQNTGERGLDRFEDGTRRRESSEGLHSRDESKRE